jgi:hypothetical protein
VNGPRVPGMLSEWALMGDSDGLVLNWLGAGRFTAKLADGTPVTITSSEDTWISGRTELGVETKAKNQFTLRVRIPAWANAPKFTQLSNPHVTAGNYALNRNEAEGQAGAQFHDYGSAFQCQRSGGKVSLSRSAAARMIRRRIRLMKRDSLVNLARLAEVRRWRSKRPPATQEQPRFSERTVVR